MPTRSLRILVVDDDPAMVGAITALVGTEGHQVITAYDGLTAVKRFRDEHPDLVLGSGRPDGTRATRLAIDLKTGRAWPEHAEVVVVDAGESDDRERRLLASALTAGLLAFLARGKQDDRKTRDAVGAGKPTPQSVFEVERSHCSGRITKLRQRRFPPSGCQASA